MSRQQRDERVKELKRQRKILAASTKTMLFDLLLLIYEELAAKRVG